ncbi:MAG: hypothetical protein GYB53_04955 [Rhodobacteraceae bacterium]|nr:hypothetical protein [Paracoccaceae bacterium]MBR9822755.1 hypothetical protein [Paracoccaceae bacterium]
MRLFHHRNRERNAETRRVYALFEIVYTLVDFLAALCFIAGSVLFFYDSLQTAGTWLFLVGSFLFAAKPSLRLAREVKLWRMGRDDTLAERLQQE